MDGQHRETEETQHLPYVAVIDVNPALAEEKEARFTFDAHLKMDPKAFILLAYATGGTPETFNPHIRELTEKGIPVFLLSNNPGLETGIQKLAYEPQLKAVEAGATPLRDVNINRMLEVVNTIQQQIKEGLTGDKLKAAIVAKYGTPEPVLTT